MMAKPSTIFISYSWESEDHSDKVLVLAETLEMKGLHVIFDQFEPFPTKPWPQWMRDGLIQAEFVLCICTKSYYERWHGNQEVGTGLGCQWEGTIMSNVGAKSPEELRKFLPILIPPTSIDTIPEEIAGNSRFTLKEFNTRDPEFKRLYALLSHQELTPRPERGELEILEPRIRTTIPRSGLVSEMNNITADDDSKNFTGFMPSRSPQHEPVGGQSPYNKRRAQELRRKAEKAHLQEDYDRSVKLLLQAHKLWGNPDFLTYALQSLLSDDKDDEALELANKILNFDPENITALGGKALLESTNAKEKLDRIQELLQRHPGDIELKILRCAVLMDMSEYEVAEKELKEVWEKDRPPNAAVMLYSLFEDLGRHEVAETWAANVVEQTPDAPISWVHYGQALAKCKRVGLALSAFKEAVKLAPRYARAIWDIGACYALMGEANRSVDYLRKAILYDPKFFEGSKLSEFDGIRDSTIFKQFLEEGVPLRGD